jgi:hypothetical protein
METDIIHGASYLVYEGSLTKDSPIKSAPGQVSKDSRLVTFYTFDGNPITTIEHNFNFEEMNSKIDPYALPPKPISYRRIWMPAFKFSADSPIVEAGYIVLFHDKHGNRIAWEVLSCEDEYINHWLEYDLSQAFEEEPDYSLKDSEINIIDEYTNYNLNDTQILFSRKSMICSTIIGPNMDLTMSMARIPNQQEIDTEEKEEEHPASASSCIIF